MSDKTKNKKIKELDEALFDESIDFAHTKFWDTIEEASARKLDEGSISLELLFSSVSLFVDAGWTLEKIQEYVEEAYVSYKDDLNDDSDEKN